MSSASTPTAQKNWRTEQCIALCDYTANDTSEISFRRGDLISVTGKRGDASGFWEGINTGTNVDVMTGKKNKEATAANSSNNAGGAVATKGLFPTCMVTSNLRAFVEPRFCDKALALYDYKPRTIEEMELEKGDVITITRPSSAANWWYGVKEGSGQRIPEEMMAKTQSKHHHKESSTSHKEKKSHLNLLHLPHHHSHPAGELLVPMNFVTTKIVVGGLACQGNASNELPFTAGDVIQIVRRWNDGWWEGLLRGQRGIFPSNLTHPNIATTDPHFLCSRCKSLLNFGSGGVARPGAVGSCAECTQNEAVVEEMVHNLQLKHTSSSDAAAEPQSSTKRNQPKVDLFEGIDLELLYGKRLALQIKGGDGALDASAPIPASAALEITTVRKFHASTAVA